MELEVDREFTSVYIWGHSFIWRLEQVVGEGRDPRAKTDFNLQPPGSVFFQYDGVGGRKLVNWRVKERRMLNSLEESSPDIVILEMGSNDISNGRNHNVVLQDIVDVCIYLQERCDVKHVIVSQILHRDLTRDVESIHDFNLQVMHIHPECHQPGTLVFDDI